jgi:hypothetical protein
MDIYKGKVRLTGSMLNEVRREDMTAPEVILLQRIHGNDAVLELEKTGTTKINHQDERQRLYLQYKTAVNVDAKRHYIEELFGPNHNDLPTSVPGAAVVAKSSKKPTAADLME